MEKAFILIDKGEIEMARETLVSNASEIDIHSAMMLAIENNFVKKFIQDMISRADRKTEDLNTLLKFIIYIAEPQRIID